MPKYLEEARKALAKAAEDGDEMEKEKARALLKAWDDDKKEKGGDGDAKARAEAEEEERKKEEARKAKAAEEDEKEKARRAAATAAERATQAGSDGVALQALAKVAELEARLAAKDEAIERGALLASRPDFSDEVKAWLTGASLDTVKKAVATIPKSSNFAAQANAALVPGATRGAADNNNPADKEYVTKETMSEYMDRKLGIAPQKHGIQREGNGVSLGFMSPAEAQAFLDAQKGGK